MVFQLSNVTDLVIHVPGNLIAPWAEEQGQVAAARAEEGLAEILAALPSGSLAEHAAPVGQDPGSGQVRRWMIENWHCCEKRKPGQTGRTAGRLHEAFRFREESP